MVSATSMRYSVRVSSLYQAHSSKPGHRGLRVLFGLVAHHYLALISAYRVEPLYRVAVRGFGKAESKGPQKELP